jgi:5-formyltetrahydrofolate cyclo-ligase
MTADLNALRRAARAARRAIAPAERMAAGKSAAAALAATLLLRAGKRIAFYAPLREEFPAAALIALARRRGCQVYLPVIAQRRLAQLRFAPLGDDIRDLRRNAFGVLEPAAPRTAWCRAADLDIVCLPLVAFDAAGHRLGMGGGFYDRALAGALAGHPLKLGLAFACQEVASVPRRAWDVPLDAVLTEHGLRRFSRRG